MFIKLVEGSVETFQLQDENLHIIMYKIICKINYW